jgi:DNA-binding MarR family transcriptional regulator
MAIPETDEPGLAVLRRSITGLVRRKGSDLSARQLSIFLTCYMDNEGQTVRGLAAKLNVSKPAISLALDRLMEFDLVRRKVDPSDRRSILVQRTQAGLRLKGELGDIMKQAAAKACLVWPGSGAGADGQPLTGRAALRRSVVPGREAER